MPSLSAGCAFIFAAAIAAGFVVAPGATAQDTPAGEPAADQTTDRDCRNGYVATLADSVTAFRLTSAVEVDGILDESVWQRPGAAPLVQNEPDNGCPPRQLTDWWVAYNDDALYVAARLHDTAPDSIVSRLIRRDNWTRSDWMFLNLDTFNDDRTGYSFRINAAGSIGDAVLYNDGWDDPSWDGVWDAAAHIDQHGWTVEIRIPFTQINFPARDRQVWGINISRRLTRHNERDDLFHLPRGESGYIQRFPDLVGIEGIVPHRQLELLPYATMKGAFLDVDADDPFRSRGDWTAAAGLDLQYGLSSNLNLTATVNPDFGQVEVDPAVVNLSDTETFFEEKRPFFVKDANVFRFGREGTNNNWNFNWMDPLLFYSRRVGRSPQLSLPDQDYVEPIGPTTILAAGKVSGKVGSTDVGFLTAVTAEETVKILTEGQIEEAVVEPLTSYSAARFKSTTRDGGRGFGALATGTWRDLNTATATAELASNAWTGGVDGWLSLDAEQVWRLRGYLSGSYVRGSADAIDLVQRSSRHYYQRPQAPHITYDPNATHLAGFAGRAMLNKQSGNVTLNTSVGGVSPGYEINDVGFHHRSDMLNWHLAAGYRWLEPNKLFRNRGFNLAAYKSWDFGGTPDGYGAGLFWHTVFANYWAVGGNFFFNPDRNSIRTTRGGPIMRVPAHREFELWFDTDTRKPIYLNPWFGAWTQPGGGQGWHVGCSVVIKPTSNIEIALTPRYNWYVDNAQWVTNEEDALMTDTFGTRHVFGDIDFNQFILGTRINWTFTPKLTLQAYLQPLFAAGAYTNLKEFAQPNTYLFNVYGQDNDSTIDRDEDDNYVIDPDGEAGPAQPFTVEDPNFNFKSLRVNVVLRWEYRRGSTFYLVWTQDRVDFADPGDFDLSRDVQSLVDTPGDNIVMAKLNYWFGL